MKFPIDVETTVQSFLKMFPDRENAAEVLRALLPIANEGYEKGIIVGRTKENS